MKYVVCLKKVEYRGRDIGVNKSLNGSIIRVLIYRRRNWYEYIGNYNYVVWVNWRFYEEVIVVIRRRMEVLLREKECRDSKNFLGKKKFGSLNVYKVWEFFSVI